MRFGCKGAVAVLITGSAVHAGDVVRPDPFEAVQRTRPPQVESDEAPAIERAFRPGGGRPVFALVGDGLSGWRLKLGTIIPGSGFAAGPEFAMRDLAQGKVAIRASARFSYTGSRLGDAELALPRVAGDRAFVNLLASRRLLPRLPYYGTGMQSSGDAPTSFLLDDTALELTAGVRPWRHVRIGGTAGVLENSVAPGTHPQYPPLVFAPGSPLASSFTTAGGFIQYDSTDLMGSARSGTDVSVRFTSYASRGRAVDSHRRVELRAQQYVPFFNRQRVIALRAWSVLTDAYPDRAVPFYLQPAIGGPDTLRGFPTFRFRDNNAALFTAEYRFRVSSGVEPSLFVDAGKVFPRAADFDLRGMRTSYGGGFRFNARGNVFLRVDAGCGGEGCQLWLRFNNAF